MAENGVDIRRPQGHKGTRRIPRRPRKGGIVLRHKVLRQIDVGRRDRRDPRHSQLVHQPILEGPIQALAAPARLGGVRRNMLDAQARQCPAHLRQLRLVHRALRLGRVKGPARAIGVQRHGNALGAQHRAQARHDGLSALAREDRRVQHALGRVIGHRNQARPGLGIARKLGVHAAVEVQHFAETGPRLPALPVPSPRAECLHQPGGLQSLFHETVGRGHAVLPLRNLMEVAHVEPRIPLPLQPQQLLELPGW